MTIFVSYALPFIVTVLVTLLLIKYPISISVPTTRGLHSKDIASSGGIAILLGLLIIPISLPVNFIYALILAAILGFFDDKYSLSIKIRLFGQALIGVLIVTSAPIYSNIYFLFWILFIIYFINIYNFMDGIDMLATSQGIFFLLAIGFIFNSYSPIFVPLLAFLIFNIHPSKIFLGNSGSYLIGTLLACYVFIIGFDFSSIPMIATCLILLTIFIVDSTYVLIKRFYNKIVKDQVSFFESIKHVVTNPHCSHNYQILTKRFANHSKVTMMLMLYNIFWCLPIAYVCFNLGSSIDIVWILLLLLLSYFPYAFYCHINRTGEG